MFDTMTFSTISALIRHALGIGAGALAGSGMITAADEQVVIGSGMALAAVGWSIVRKWLRNQRLGTPR